MSNLKTNHQPVLECIASSAGANLRHTELISIFTPDEKRKSLSYRLTFQHPELTLTNEQVDSDLTKIRQSLTEKLAASFRT